MKTPALVDLEDGRKIEVRTAGPEDGEILLFHHGTPGAGLPFRPWVESAAARRLRTVMYSRPGYGLSTADPGRKVVDAASDAAAVIDAIGATTFRTIGWSGGGPHALACAAALPDRCLATVAVAGFAPYPADGIDWFAGMADENVTEYSLALRGEGALTPFLEASAHAFAAMQPTNLTESFGGLLSEADKAQVTGEFAEWLAETLRVGLACGIAGSRDDELAETSDWGFHVADARSVVIWHGAQDRMVPPPTAAGLPTISQARVCDCSTTKGTCPSSDCSTESSMICWIPRSNPHNSWSRLFREGWQFKTRLY